jgi:hypothetical protein
MGMKSLLSRPVSSFVARKVINDAYRPLECQEKVFRMLLDGGRRCIYGKAHGLREVETYDDFRKHVPVIGYEDIRPLIERISGGEENILWPGLPIYFAKTSGTTSGMKYIPITRDSISNHIDSARNALLMYMHHSRNFAFADHSMIFLQGSPVLDEKGIIPAGRLSGIVAHHVPPYLQRNRMPSWETNCIEDWETKVDAIVEETLKKRMSLISGIPSWLRMYFEKLVHKAGKPVGEIFPDFSLLVYGGLNYEPYRKTFDQLIGRHVDTVELYPASEGFIAYQDLGPGEGLLLNVNSGIFYEFIPADKAHEEAPPRIPLEDVEVGKDYAIVLTTNAGLWAYSLGDLVRFVSRDPFRLIVTGRVSQFLSAFGEHVIASEVEGALAEVCRATGVQVDEFHVAPMVNPPDGGLPYHQWIVEFGTLPVGTLPVGTLPVGTLPVGTLPVGTLHATSLQGFIEKLDQSMRCRNPYYDDLVAGHVLQPLKIVEIPRGTFQKYLSSIGKLGGQNKVPHLADSREIADAILMLNSL